MEEYFKRAIRNVINHGDTDIFPFPMENYLFRDCEKETLDQLTKMHASFQNWMANNPPANEGALVPVSYTGFRWGTQLDPLWNIYFLGLILSISEEIEKERVPEDEKCVFSYRYAWDNDSSSIFSQKSNWRAFMEQSLQLARNYKYVLICDISEFYSRVGHHRIENALGHLNLKTDTPSRVMGFLSNFSNTNSFGLPVGGPAARILSELVLNQIDQLLKLDGVIFCRYSDDFHIYADSMEACFSILLSLTEKLQRTQGLQLQKSKTRIMTSPEFITTSPVRIDDHDAPPDEDDETVRAHNLLEFSIRFDPYSPNSVEDYDELKREIEKFDIIGLLQSELSKSRIHVALSRKIVAAIRYLNGKQQEQAVISLLDNSELLYPIMSSVFIVVKQVFEELSETAQIEVINRIINMYNSGSHVLRVDLFLAYAVRILAARPSAGVQETLVRIYNNTVDSPLVRRDVILAMTRLGAWHWLSDRRNSFRGMTSAERRAFIIASFALRDEGKHWRHHVSEEFSPLERLVRDWAAPRFNQPNWVVPL